MEAQHFVWDDLPRGSGSLTTFNYGIGLIPARVAYCYCHRYFVLLVSVALS